MRRLILIWILNALALMAVAYLMPSIVLQSFFSALGAAFLLGTVNTLIRPVLITKIGRASCRERV